MALPIRRRSETESAFTGMNRMVTDFLRCRPVPCLDERLMMGS